MKSCYGCTAYETACYFNIFDPVLKAMPVEGAWIGEEDFNAIANYCPDPGMIREYLEGTGYDVDKRGEYGKTPLAVAAAENPRAEITKALLDCGADVNSRSDDGYTTLMYALEDNYHTGVAQMLLSYGADAYAKDIDGRTSFDIAAEDCPESLNDIRMAFIRGQT